MKKHFLLVIASLLSVSVQAQSAKPNFRGAIANNKVDTLKLVSPMKKWTLPIAIDKKGNLSATVQQGAGNFKAQYGKREFTVYLTNESNISFTADGANFVQTLKFEGTDAAENNFMAEMGRDVEKLSNKLPSDINQEDFKKVSDSVRAAWTDKLLAAKFNPEVSRQVRTHIIMESSYLLIKVKRKVVETDLIGKPTPQFSYADVNGKTVKLSDFKGKYVYIDVWATWCGPCRQQIPKLKEIEELFKDKNIAFVSVSIDKPEDIEKWKQMVHKDELGGTQVIAENAWKSQFVKDYGITSIPRFILIDPKGNVVDDEAQRPTDPKLEKRLKKLLN